MNRNMEAIVWALHVRGLNPVAWKVLVRGLCERVNNERGDFDVWPSHQQIADDCEISASSVKRHLIELERAGVIEKVARQRENGGTSSNCYRLLVRTKHFMPHGVVNVDARRVGQADLPPQVNLTYPPGQSDLPPQVTADLCNEPVEERTYPIGRVTPPDNVDLFGQPILSDEQLEQQKRDALVASIETRWHEVAKGNPIVPDIVSIHERRRELVFKVTEKHRPYGTNEEIWSAIFERIAESRLLRGLVKPTGDREEPWSVSFDWLLSRDKSRNWNMAKVLEGNYRDKRADHDGFDASTGRKLTGIEEAGRNVDRRLRESRERVYGGGDLGGDPTPGPQRSVRRMYGRAGGPRAVG